MFKKFRYFFIIKYYKEVIGLALESFKISKKCFNEVYLKELQNYNKRYNVFYGGAGSGKSHFVVQKLILKYLKYSNRKCLVTRKVGNTLKDSIYALFKSVLWGLENIRSMQNK